jgi:biopolymer transport protein ExbB/TolQ
MEQSQGLFTFIATQYQKGGWVMHLIAAAGCIAVAFIIEKWLRLRQYKISSAESFMVEIQKYILANDIDGAIRACNGSGKSALAKVIKAGLQRASRDETQIQNAIDAASLEVIPKLERNLNYLALIANISTLFGLFGTIIGLIKSFEAVALADPAQRQAILAAGISEAMNATAFGLIVAIVSMIAHSYLSSKASIIIEEIDEYGVKLLDLLTARRYKHSSEKNL